VTTATAIAYSLPSVVTVNGTFAVTVYSEYDFAVDGVVAPTIQTILEIGDLKENANVTVGVSEIENLTLSVRDDHSAAGTPEGFWFKVLQGECWVKLYLDGTYFFFGTVDKPTVAWEEHAIVSSTRIRTASFSLITMSKKLFETSIDDFVTEVVAKCYDLELAAPTIDVATHVIKVTELFACILKASGLNADYGTLVPPWDANVELLYGTQPEMNYTVVDDHYNVDDIYVPVKYCVSTGPTVIGLCQYFDPATDNCLAQQADGTGYYGSMQAFLSDLLTNFGLIMRMEYDAVTTWHKIKLMYRHDVYTGELTFASREKTSEISFSQQVIGDAAKATDLADGSKYAWVSKKYRPVLTTYDPLVPTSEADARVNFDLDAKCIFIANPGVVAAPNGAANRSIAAWSGVAGEDVEYVDGVEYYSTAIADMAGYAVADDLNMQRAACSYQYERFIRYFTTIMRTYGRMEASDGATTSFAHLTIMKRTKINTLGSDVYYFANSVTKKAMSAEVTIEWQQED
jgi:hypothetical protein